VRSLVCRIKRAHKIYTLHGNEKRLGTVVKEGKEKGRGDKERHKTV
jgi:hypothetical protein